jgi:hypothetical protein
MNSSLVEIQVPLACGVTVSHDALTVALTDGRTISVPLAWNPRLWYATSDERSHWRLIGSGQGIHWLDLDEDISVEGLLQGRHSGESQHSLKQWLARRSGSQRGPDEASVVSPPSKSC